ILVRVRRDQHHRGRLEELLTALDVLHAGRAAVAVDLDGGNVGAGNDVQAFGGLRLRDRCHRGRALGIDVTSSAQAVAVIGAAGPAVVAFARNRGGTGERVPAGRLRG